MANVRQESELGDGEDGIDGVWGDGEVLQVLCNFFQTEQTRTWNIKDLVTLAYSDLDNSKENEHKFICNETM